MSFNGSGTFLINTAGQPVVPNTVISSTAFNALTADLANGLSTCITKDGQTTPTANIPMGNNKITGLAAGTAGTDAANLSQVQGSTAKLLQSVTGTDTITAAMIPALTAYAAGQMFYFVAAGDNTGAVTINIDSLGAKSVTRDGSTALVAGDITNGKVVVIVYDGTRFQLLNSNAFTNLYVSGNLGIGTTSPGARLDVRSAVGYQLYTTVTDATSAGGIRTFNSNTVGLALLTYGPSYSGGSIGSVGQNGSVVVQTGNAPFLIGTDIGISQPLLFATNGIEQMRLDSSGNLGIGTTSPGSRLQVAGGYISQTDGTVTTFFGADGSGGSLAGTTTNHYFRFITNNTEKMRLDSSGNLGIGTTSPGARLDVQAPVLDIRGLSTTGTNYVRQRMSNNGGDFYYGIDTSTGANFGTAYAAALWYTGAYPMVFATNNAERMRITSTGNIVAGASAALATTATNGFLYVPTCAGTPTGTPTAITGMAPIVVNTTNNKLYFYSGGSWRDAGP